MWLSVFLNAWLLLLQLTHLAIWGSIVTWFLFLAFYSHVWPTFDLAPEMVGMVCIIIYVQNC